MSLPLSPMAIPEEGPHHEVSAASSERLLVSGAPEQAAAVAEAVLRAGRRRALTPVEKRLALSVVIQAYAQLKRFHSLELLFNETIGGLQELPSASMLLWAAIGCDEGELERVVATLQLRLKFVQNGKRKMSSECVTATARMCAIEVLAKDGKSPARAKTLAKQWESIMDADDYEELILELDALDANKTLSVADMNSAAHAVQPPSPEIQEASPQCSPRHSFDLEAPSLAAGTLLTTENLDGANAATDHTQQAEERGGSAVEDAPWSQRMATYLHEVAPDALKEMSPEQLAVAGVAGAAVLYALYCERRSLRRAVRRYLGM